MGAGGGHACLLGGAFRGTKPSALQLPHSSSDVDTGGCFLSPSLSLCLSPGKESGQRRERGATFHTQGRAIAGYHFSLLCLLCLAIHVEPFRARKCLEGGQITMSSMLYIWGEGEG